MTDGARQGPALVALAMVAALALWLSFVPTNHKPSIAVPAPVTHTADEAASAASRIRAADLEGRLARHGSSGRAVTVEGSTPTAAGTGPAGDLPSIPSIVIPAVAGIVWPANGPITSSFGLRLHPILQIVKLHTGMDLGLACGTPVAAALPGVVTYVGVDPAYGGRVVVDHGLLEGHRIATTYSHLSAFGVRVGQIVSAGTGIALSGSTGYSTGCHLHFELLVDGAFADPEPWLRTGTVPAGISVGSLTSVPPVASPVPEPEVPNETTTPLSASTPNPSITPSPAPSPSPVPSLSPTSGVATPSGTPSVAPSASGSGSLSTSAISAAITPAPTPSASGSTPSSSSTLPRCPSVSLNPSVSTTPAPTLTPKPSCR